MRICLVHEEYPEETNFGGIATYQKNLAEELVKLGHTVYVLTRGLRKSRYYQENGINIIRICVKSNDNYNSYFLYRKKIAIVLKRLQDKNLIDIIETPDWGAETIFFEKYRKIPLVVRLHTPLKIWLKYNKNDFGKIKNRLLNWESKMIRSADLITCCSNALKKKIVNNFLISKYKIVVNPNPANLNNFYCDKNCLKENKLIYVGSLEERKGVCVLAKALNIVMKKYPNLKIEFIGKDTKRNSKNKSTKELIYEIVNKKYHQNLNFFGQIPNNEINKYLNTSLVAVFPSLFDNFPYVVLEAMSCGLHIVGSQNSGMVEMINDSNSLYKTGNVNNLALKIEEKYLLALKNNYNFDNIERVKKFYNSKNVCQNIIELYKNVITKYVDKNINKDDFQYLLKNIDRSDVIKFSKEKNGLANSVFKVTTRKKVYIVKKYNYNYDFNLANNLYDIYNINNINVVKPLNKKVIFYKNHYFNVFLYIKDEIPKNINLNFLSKFILINRKIDSENLLLKKCDFYYCNIKKDIKNIPYDHISYVLKEYENLSLVNTINNYLNHGDIQKSNIIKSNKKYYLIDFDETVVGPYLYDFAVIIIKFYSKRKLNWNKFNKLKKIIKIQNENLKDEDFYNIIKLYLCKILLEKFYYHSIGKINLLSKFQKKDNYIRYMKLLKSIGR